ncbi:outer membrane lipoprotein-sorting protein [Pseudoduganella eburnea]|uniref:Outer membrane lipoprotein-sorting protein n=1 Tax=Massilia eburnea TaxID=1776165 RepID=A0A6L6QKZ5_9BURK|nr:outer membrane lipoprotein-sorting protein [Massilia eburnea]MTW13128.1 outer membrane lipoprotein-sorting protein [Massilia eburnea]
MFKTLIAAALAVACGSAAADDVDAILRKADSYRMPHASAQMDSLVQTFKDGKLDKEKRYQVLVRAGGKSLILFRSPGEAGQKVLMSGDDFWMLLPGSARPIRITPLQKLLGDASTGDIATLTWSGDYHGNVVREVDVDGVHCLELELAATRKTLSYQRVVLQVAKADYRPLHADLYATSNKRLKQAHYSQDRMVLVDEIANGRETVITTSGSRARQFGDELFNPMYLVRSDAAP